MCAPIARSSLAWIFSHARYLFELLCAFFALLFFAFASLVLLLIWFAPSGWLHTDAAHLTGLALVFVGALLAWTTLWPVGAVLLLVGAALLAITYSARKHSARGE